MRRAPCRSSASSRRGCTRGWARLSVRRERRRAAGAARFHSGGLSWPRVSCGGLGCGPPSRPRTRPASEFPRPRYCCTRRRGPPGPCREIASLPPLALFLPLPGFVLGEGGLIGRIGAGESRASPHLLEEERFELLLLEP